MDARSTTAVQRPSIYIVDDHADVLAALTCGLELLKFDPRGFCSAEEVLGGNLPAPACIILDYDLGSRNGLEVVEFCRKAWPDTAMLMITGMADVSVAAQAMRLGTRNVLPKPIDPPKLAREIREAIASHRQSVDVQVSSAQQSLEELNPREREILKLITEGVPNKNIAHRMSLAMRTIEKRRRHIFDLLKVDSAAEATRIYVLATLRSDN